MGSHTLQQLKRYSFDELKELLETIMKNVNTFVPMETEDRGRASELATGSSQATITDSAEVGSSKRAAEAELDHECSKRQKTNEASGSVQEQPGEEEKELEQTPLFPSILAIQEEVGEGSGHPSKPQPPPSTTQPIHEEPIPNVTSDPIPNVPDEAVYEEWDDRVERDTTTTASLDAAQV
ncbi:hypothetical protein Tco_0519692 [Tanacetum coccineum]